jgi:hypothetical protein
MNEQDKKEFEKQAAEILRSKNVDDEVHLADSNKGGLSTLCGKPISQLKQSAKWDDITCEPCRAVSKRIVAAGS